MMFTSAPRPAGMTATGPAEARKPLAQKEREQVYHTAARELTVRFVQRIASLLHDAPDVPFDVDAADAARSQLLFDLCFLGIVQLEEQSGIEAGQVVVTPSVAFTPHDGTGTAPVLTSGSPLHRFVEEDTLSEGIARARAALTGPAVN